jgi:hypothetical protein
MKRSGTARGLCAPGARTALGSYPTAGEVGSLPAEGSPLGRPRNAFHSPLESTASAEFWIPEAGDLP